MKYLENFSPRSYARLFHDIRRSGPHLASASMIFAAGIWLGLAFPDRFSNILKTFKDTTTYYFAHTTLFLIALIFFRNSLAALLSIALGPFLGIVPTIGAVTNGILLGVVISLAVTQDKASSLLYLLPHGIFELPAVVLAWGLGIWRGMSYLLHNKKPAPDDIRSSAYRAYFLIIIPLLLVAAIIEGILIHSKGT